MAKHGITVDEAVDNKVVDAVQEGLGGWLAEQPWFVQRKDTIAVVLGFVAQLLSAAGFISETLPTWAFVTIIVVAFLAQVGTIALTKAPITPSIVDRAIDVSRVAAAPKPDAVAVAQAALDKALAAAASSDSATASVEAAKQSAAASASQAATATESAKLADLPVYTGPTTV